MSDALSRFDRPLDPGIRLETARNLRTQHLEMLQSAIREWWDSAGAGHSHAVDRRFVRLCIDRFRWFERLAYQRYRETIGNRRAA